MDREEVEELLEDAWYALLSGEGDEAMEIYESLEGSVENGGELEARIVEGKASVHIKAGRFPAAYDEMMRALACYGDSVSNYYWNNLGFILDKLGRYEEAESAHRKGIIAMEAELGPDHPRVAKKLSDHAYSLIGLGRLDDAEALLRESVARFEKQPDREPLWFARALNNLGHFLFRSRRNPQKALECFDRIDHLREKASLVIKGRVVREGFPDEFEQVLQENRGAALKVCGRMSRN